MHVKECNNLESQHAHNKTTTDLRSKQSAHDGHMALSTRHVEAGAAVHVRRIDLRVTSQQKVDLR